MYVPHVRITDKLANDSAAKRAVLSSVEQRQRRSLNRDGWQAGTGADTLQLVRHDHAP
jgi:hypothetical protein